MRLGPCVTELACPRWISWTTVSLVLSVTLGLLAGCQLTTGGSYGSGGRSNCSTLGNLGDDCPWGIAPQWQRDKPLVIEGRVLDITGTPLGKADVAVLASLIANNGLHRNLPVVLGQATTNGRGTFCATMPSLPSYQVQSLSIIARRNGYGMGIHEMNADDLHQTVTFHLDQEQIVRGRVAGPDGHAAARIKMDLRMFGEICTSNRSEITWGPEPERRPAAWPEPPVTDEQGRFVLHGIPQSEAETLWLDIVVTDSRFAPFNRDLYFGGAGQRAPYLRVRNASADELAIQLEAPTFIRGRVICRDTKQPIPYAWLSVFGCDMDVQPADTQACGVWVQANVKGRFEARIRPSKYVVIYTYPPLGLPYPAWSQVTEIVEGTNPHEVNVEVPRGILLRGKVIEEGSGRGVAGAGVEYQMRTYDKEFKQIIYWAAEYRQVLTFDDGTFEMAVVPGVAHLMVKAPSPDFITQFITFGDLQHDQPGGFFYGVNGLVKIDPKPGIDLVEATIPLRRGLTVHCQVVGPQGQPVDKAALLTPTDSLMGLNDINSAYVHVVFNGRLELHGCDPSNLRRIYILDNKNQWGATVDVNADKLQGKTLTVRLLPCGVATMRLVDQDGHPWDSCHPAITVQLVYLNSPASTFDRNWDDHLGWFMWDLDKSRYAPLQTNSQGRVTLPTLIPTAPYILRFYDGRPEPKPRDTQAVEKWLKETEFEFSVRPSQTLDLGEITIIRSQGPQ